VVQLVQEVDNVVEEIVIDQIVMNNKDLLHQIKVNNHQHHLNNMMINKAHIEVDNVVVVVVVINVVLLVVIVKVVQMPIQMRQHLIIQMIFPLFQSSKMVKLTQKKNELCSCAFYLHKLFPTFSSFSPKKANI
jgi:hypothetical protein